jgi:hypothetical protein
MMAAAAAFTGAAESLASPTSGADRLHGNSVDEVRNKWGHAELPASLHFVVQ